MHIDVSSNTKLTEKQPAVSECCYFLQHHNYVKLLIYLSIYSFVYLLA